MSYQKCFLCGEGPTIRHDTSRLCQSCKISTGLTAREAKEKAIFYWRQVTGIENGMERSEALSKFIDFRDNPTCERCEEKKLKEFCSANLICKQADEMEVINDGGNESGEVGIQETESYFTG